MSTQPATEGALATHRTRALVFDLDGTLVDSYQAIAASLNHARAHFGLDPLAPDEVRVQVGWGLEALMERNLGCDRVEAGVALFRQHYARVHVGQTRLLPGVAVTLVELHRRGYPMAVATNKPEHFSRSILGGLGLAPLFTRVCGAREGVQLKPEPQLLEEALRALRVEPGQAVYVGDMEVDVITARRAGVPVWVLATGSADREQLERAGADRLLERFDQLLELLGGRRAG